VALRGEKILGDASTRRPYSSKPSVLVKCGDHLLALIYGREGGKSQLSERRRCTPDYLVAQKNEDPKKKRGMQSSRREGGDHGAVSNP